jgi:hypothetical protein
MKQKIPISRAFIKAQTTTRQPIIQNNGSGLGPNHNATVQTTATVVLNRNTTRAPL